jgi:hypothetical protein
MSSIELDDLQKCLAVTLTPGFFHSAAEDCVLSNTLLFDGSKGNMRESTH